MSRFGKSSGKVREKKCKKSEGILQPKQQLKELDITLEEFELDSLHEISYELEELEYNLEEV